MSWALSGTYFENCTCEGACPCTASSFQWPADKDFCDVMFAFHVDSGEIDETAVEDLSVVLLVHIPQAQATDGNWKLGTTPAKTIAFLGIATCAAPASVRSVRRPRVVRTRR